MRSRHFPLREEGLGIGLDRMLEIYKRNWISMMMPAQSLEFQLEDNSQLLITKRVPSYYVEEETMCSRTNNITNPGLLHGECLVSWHSAAFLCLWLF